MNDAKAPQGIIFFGFTTGPREGNGLPVPDFRAPANFKDKDKIAAAVKERKDAFAAESAGSPFYGEVDVVFLADPLHERVETFRRSERPAGGKKKPLGEAVAAWVLRQYPAALWPSPFRRGDPPAVFVGFEPRQFFKLLGTECAALPPDSLRLPPGLWLGQGDCYRDVAELAAPKDFFRPAWPDVLRYYGVALPPDVKWSAPGFDAETDAGVAADLALRLGIFEGADEDDEPEE